MPTNAPPMKGALSDRPTNPDTRRHWGCSLTASPTPKVQPGRRSFSCVAYRAIRCTGSPGRPPKAPGALFRPQTARWAACTTCAAVRKVLATTDNPMSAGSRQGGFTYVAVLFLVAVAGLGVATLAETWWHARQRQKEAQLLWVGNQFRQAIGLYYERSPGNAKRYPQTLDDLLEDQRFVTKQRYLRRIYFDPVTGKPDWDLLSAPGGGIMGVKSRSAARPIGAMSGTPSYASWEFAYEPALNRR